MAKADKADKRPNIRNLLEELDSLGEAHRLLEKIYHEIGPYQDGKVTDKTWDEVRNYFDFDDSE